MDIKKTITYQLINADEEENKAWFSKCSRVGDPVTEIEGWINSKGLTIISLGHGRWLIPVLDHTGKERYDQ